MNLTDDILPADRIRTISVSFIGEDAILLERLGAELSMQPTSAAIELVRRLGPLGNGRGFSAICANCGLPYTAFHRPKPDVKHYCQREECKREAAADRARRYRSRKSGGRR